MVNGIGDGGKTTGASILCQKTNDHSDNRGVVSRLNLEDWFISLWLLANDYYVGLMVKILNDLDTQSLWFCQHTEGDMTPHCATKQRTAVLVNEQPSLRLLWIGSVISVTGGVFGIS